MFRKPVKAWQVLEGELGFVDSEGLRGYTVIPGHIRLYRVI